MSVPIPALRFRQLVSNIPHYLANWGAYADRAISTRGPLISSRIFSDFRNSRFDLLSNPPTNATLHVPTAPAP
jgi:hypothetical protein